MYYIGVDLGTSAVKLILMDKEGSYLQKIKTENSPRNEFIINNIVPAVNKKSLKKWIFFTGLNFLLTAIIYLENSIILIKEVQLGWV